MSKQPTNYRANGSSLRLTVVELVGGGPHDGVRLSVPIDSLVLTVPVYGDDGEEVGQAWYTRPPRKMGRFWFERTEVVR